MERSMVPPALATATAVTRPSEAELRDAGAVVTGGKTSTDAGRRTSMDANSKTFSI